ncbi:MFS transporter [Xenorhabdus ehlersii]|uniref:EmrB/QacA subfamily drug resistance transporter n=1 Tax=Xenorhabdus ehlersii TaxID=290111 RepID=A0A2D0IS17_9GAMM|nr:MFS transporter [Xenorhabdus ehlersii]PHM24620.1 putative transporter [Xenorhabdus ehlersii]RKE91259.1 EmrB/QacA subfamily drug resistance transporter [Xenorhabdus ehlersii]
MTKKEYLALSVLLSAGFVTIFDLFVVNIAIANLQLHLQASLFQITLVIVTYEIGFGLLLITGGRLGDLFGRKRLFQLGILAFTLTSLLCGFAPTATFLIFARFLQGLSAALLFPQVYASIRVSFDDDNSRRAFGLLGMTLGFAAIAGQTLGGWMISANLWDLQWRSIFLVNVPIGLLALIFSRYLNESIAQEKTELDLTGVVLSSIGISALLLPLLVGPTLNWPMWCWISFFLACLTLLQFFLHEKRYVAKGKTPLFNFDLLKNKQFSLGCLLVLSVYSTSSSFFLVFALLLQNGLGFNPLDAGLIFAPASVGFILSSLNAPYWVKRFGSKAIITGSLLYVLSFIALIVAISALSPTNSLIFLIVPILTFLGYGQGFVMTPLLNIVLAFVNVRFAGMASGVIATLQQIGAAFGVAMVSILVQWHFNEIETLLFVTYQKAFVYSMLYNVIAAFIAFYLLKRLHRK